MTELSLNYICARNLLLKGWMQGENNHKSTAESCCQEDTTAQIASEDSLVKYGHWHLWKKQATHKPSLKAAFFSYQPGLTDGPCIIPWADTKTSFVSTWLYGSKKDSRSEGCPLRKARLFPRTAWEARKHSWRCKTGAELGPEIQGNTWLA